MHQEAFTLLRPSLLVARLCGVNPPTHSLTSYKKYTIAIGLIAVSGIMPFIKEVLAGFHGITAFTYIIFVLLNLISHWVMLVMPFLSMNDFRSYFSSMQSAQLTLFRLNIRQPHTQTNKAQICWIIVFSLPYIISLLIQLLNREFFHLILNTAYYSVRVGTLCKLRVLLALVNEKFELLNWHLDDLNNRWPLFLPRPPDVTFSEFASVSNFRRSKFVNYDQDTRRVTADKIHAFNQAHFLLCYACKSLNSTFSLIGLVLFLCLGVTIPIGILHIYLSMGSWHQQVSWFLYTTHSCVSQLTILVFTSMVKEKSRKTALLVHDLLDEDGHSDDVIEELEEFSKALLHRKVNFSAAGFFDLDLKLVSRMASILAPITLFLVQNDNRHRAGHNKRPN